MADEAEISAFEASVNARINESAAALSEWLRPSEAAAHRCVADALDDRSLTTAEAHAKGDACTARVSGARARFADEMQGFQRKLHACHGDTEAVLKADFKGKGVDEAALVAAYMRLLRPCVDGHLAGLPAALERVKAGGAAPAAKAKSSGWFA